MFFYGHAGNLICVAYSSVIVKFFKVSLSTDPLPALILGSSKIIYVISDGYFLVCFREKQITHNRRAERGNKVSLMCAVMCTDHRTSGIASEPVCQSPFSSYVIFKAVKVGQFKIHCILLLCVKKYYIKAYVKIVMQY